VNKWLLKIKINFFNQFTSEKLNWEGVQNAGKEARSEGEKRKNDTHTVREERKKPGICSWQWQFLTIHLSLDPYVCLALALACHLAHAMCGNVLDSIQFNSIPLVLSLYTALTNDDISWYLFRSSTNKGHRTSSKGARTTNTLSTMGVEHRVAATTEVLTVQDLWMSR